MNEAMSVSALRAQAQKTYWSTCGKYVALLEDDSITENSVWVKDAIEWKIYFIFSEIIVSFTVFNCVSLPDCDVGAFGTGPRTWKRMIRYVITAERTWKRTSSVMKWSCIFLQGCPTERKYELSRGNSPQVVNSILLRTRSRAKFWINFRKTYLWLENSIVRKAVRELKVNFLDKFSFLSS